jgi:hypothetical protein
MEGQVVRNCDPKGEGRIGVFIPKIMFENDYNEDPYDFDNDSLINKKDSEVVKIELDSGKLTKYVLNYKATHKDGTSPDFEDTEKKFKQINYIWVRPTSFYDEFNAKSGNQYNAGSYRVPRVGASVFVFFLDSDPQKGYYLPITPTKESDELTFTDTTKPCSTWNNVKTRPYMDIIRSYFTGMRIEADNKEQCIRIINHKGDMVQLSPRGIDLVGDVNVFGNLRVYDDADFAKKNFKNTPSIHSSFEVLNPSSTGEEIPITRLTGIGYIYDEDEEVDNIIPSMNEIEEYVDAQDDDEESTQEVDKDFQGNY